MLVSCEPICQNNTFLYLQDDISLDVSFTSPYKMCVLVECVAGHGHRLYHVIIATSYTVMLSYK